ncbi:MAG TPA: hypothetical protein VNI83_02265 [Vicinamibacterales bacterium]|nr:hypothetical protein [Vicinamibacterales bacterium]
MPPYQRHSDTSRAAAYSMRDRAPTVRERIYVFMRDRGAYGATRDEVEVALGLRMQTVNGRIAELKAAGLIRETDMKRATRSGRLAHVFVAVGYAHGTQPQLFAVPGAARYH